MNIFIYLLATISNRIMSEVDFRSYKYNRSSWMVEIQVIPPQNYNIATSWRTTYRVT